ncbi:MAG: DEAD/DEAH box helicase [Comamonas sp.]
MTHDFSVQGDAAPAERSISVDSDNTSALDRVVAQAALADDGAEAVVAAEADAVEVVEVPNGFVELGLAPELLQAVQELGYTQPTAVQEQTIPFALQGDAGSHTDLMVSSQTGSGKTAAFLLPVLHTLLQQQAEAQAAERAEYERLCAEAAANGEPAPKRPKRKNPMSPRSFKAAQPGALVLCPTRELAQQVAHDAIELVRHCKGLRIANVVGGIPYQLQIAKLQNANLVVATPGRLLDLQRSLQIKLDQVQFLVVDEADRMLDLGFSDDLAEINQLTIARRQTMMFSATFAPRIQQLAMRVMHDNGASVKKIQIATPQEKHANIEQKLFWADNSDHKRRLLDHWLRDTTINQAIVFASTQIECDGLAGDLQQAGFSAVALHGALSQGLRNRRLMALRNGQVQILVATDVAARGIDVPTITHVFNYGLPMKAEDYTHRIGRTGRAGRAGLAVTFAEFRDRRRIFDIEAYTRQQFTADVVPGLEPTQRFPSGRNEGPRGGGRGDRGRPAGRGGFGGDRGGFGGDRGGRNERGGDRGFAPRRDQDGYGRKPGFGDAGAGRRDGRFEDRRPAGGDARFERRDQPAERRFGGGGGERSFERNDRFGGGGDRRGESRGGFQGDNRGGNRAGPGAPRRAAPAGGSRPYVPAGGRGRGENR